MRVSLASPRPGVHQRQDAEGVNSVSSPWAPPLLGISFLRGLGQCWEVWRPGGSQNLREVGLASAAGPTRDRGWLQGGGAFRGVVNVSSPPYPLCNFS